MPPKVGKANIEKTEVPLFDKVFLQDEDVTEEVESLYHMIKIDANNLGTEAEKHASLFARVAFMAEEASSQAFFLKRKLEVKKAEVDGLIRREAVQDGGKKPTEGQIENEVILNGTVMDVTEAYLVADRAARIIGVLKESLRHRRDLLVELMRDQRHESSNYGND